MTNPATPHTYQPDQRPPLVLTPAAHDALAADSAPLSVNGEGSGEGSDDQPVPFVLTPAARLILWKEA